jgi:hypothetical protein
MHRPEHPDTLASRQGLAHWTGAAGDPAGARDQFAELLPICGRMLGAGHPDTMAASHGLARCGGEAGCAPVAYVAFLPGA